MIPKDAVYPSDQEAESAERKRLWIATLLCFVVFALAGGLKLLHPEWLQDTYELWGLSELLMPAVGVFELCCALLLLVPRAAPYAAIALGVEMACASCLHLWHGEWGVALFPMILAVLLVGIYQSRRWSAEEETALPPRQKSEAPHWLSSPPKEAK